MKILLSGGGTGGHITPILALSHELKQLQPDCITIYVGERNSSFAQLTVDSKVIDERYGIFSGKLRRYHGEPWYRRLLDVQTNLKNIRDMFYVVVGFFQSLRLLGKLKPDVVFLKGGYVGVPIGLAAVVRRIPIITHDSDAVPGLANRLISRWVRIHATALPAALYNYPPEKTRQVGVLVEHGYQPVDEVTQAAAKQQLQLPPDEPLLLITGGSLGAERINKAVVAMLPGLLKSSPTLHVIHQTGKGKAAIYGDYHHDRLKVVEFMQPMPTYTAAADVIVTRAGANALAEFGVQGKACIVVPNSELVGGHQTKNAGYLKEQGAIEVLEESELYDLQHGFVACIQNLLRDGVARKQLANTLQQVTIADAAHKLALVVLEEVETKNNHEATA